MRPSQHVAKGAAALGASAAAAHAISVVTLPILALMFTPAEFGASAEALAAMAILAALAGLKIETAIALPASDDEAVRLAIASALIAVCICLVAAVLLLVVQTIGWVTHGLLAQAYAWLVPPGALIISLTATASQLLARHSHVRVLAKAKIISSTVAAVSQVALGAAKLGASGLIVGDWLGRTAGLWRSTGHLVQSARRSGCNLSIRRCLAGAWHYRAHSAWLAPASVVDSLGLQMPVILMVMWGGDSEGGKFGLAQRALALPVALAAQSVSKLYLPTLAKTIRDNPYLASAMVRSTAQLMGMMAALLLCIPLAIVLLPRVPIDLGPWSSWAGLLHYLVPLGVLAAFQVVGSPLSNTLIALGDQKLFAIWSTSRLAMVISGMSLGQYIGGTIGAAWGLMAGGSLGYTVLLLLIRKRILRVGRQ